MGEQAVEMARCPGDGCEGCPGCHGLGDAPPETPVVRRTRHPAGRCLSVQCGRCWGAPSPIVLDLDDPYFNGQPLPDALGDYTHVHSTTGVCVKNAHGPLCAIVVDSTPPGRSGTADPEAGT